MRLNLQSYSRLDLRSRRRLDVRERFTVLISQVGGTGGLYQLTGNESCGERKRYAEHDADELSHCDAGYDKHRNKRTQ